LNIAQSNDGSSLVDRVIDWSQIEIAPANENEIEVPVAEENLCLILGINDLILMANTNLQSRLSLLQRLEMKLEYAFNYHPSFFFSVTNSNSVYAYMRAFHSVQQQI
jgi:hypothetical protein